MNQKDALLKLLDMTRLQGEETLELLKKEDGGAQRSQMAVGLSQTISSVQGTVPAQIYAEYREYFSGVADFCRRCGEPEFIKKNVELLLSALQVFVRCMDELRQKCDSKIHKCPCCGQVVIYQPLPDYYDDMTKKYNTPQMRSETLNAEAYSCPSCGASDRDRMILAFLQKEKLRDAAEGTRVLQIAPAAAVSAWIEDYCPHIQYETTDLYMEGVTFHSDIQNMVGVPDEAYDVIICSHVLEHVKDDGKALKELKRILKPDGKIIFLVPVNLLTEGVDEEWGLPEAENWRRFGQGDHCRLYGKQGLTDRLEKQFFVHALGKDYFGGEIFKQCALTDTSTLYVLTKAKEVSLSLAEKVEFDETFLKEGPLVSVLLPCYNHEKYVARAIESVLNQTYKNIEFIVGDDGSTDKTPEIMKKYSKYFDREIYLEENTGGGYMKEIERSATGKYIALMHSDDFWEPEKLALQVAYMEEHEECGACLSWSMYVDDSFEEQRDWIFVKTNRSSEEWMRFFWEQGNALCNPSSLIRRDLNIVNGMNPYWQLPDFFKWIEVVQHREIYVIPKVLVKMGWRMGGASQNTSADTLTNQRRAAIELGSGWLNVIRKMDSGFLVRTFHDIMRNPEAETEEEIKCEKFFLLLKHENAFVQNSAWSYLGEIWQETETVFFEKYHYTRKDIADEILKKGIARMLRN